MKNLKLLQLLESVLGKGKSTSGNNIAFFSPFTSHYKPKLEIDINTNHAGENPWHCWISDKKGRTISSLFKQMGLSKEWFEQLSKIIESSRYRVNAETTPVPFGLDTFTMILPTIFKRPEVAVTLLVANTPAEPKFPPVLEAFK